MNLKKGLTLFSLTMLLAAAPTVSYDAKQVEKSEIVSADADVKAEYATVDTIDGKNTVINDDGSVTINAELTGTGLSTLYGGNVRVKAGKYASYPTGGVTYNDTTGIAEVSHTYSAESLRNSNFDMAIIVNYGTSYEDTIDLVSSVDITDEKTVGDYSTFIRRTSATTPIQIGAESSVVSVDRVDAKATTIEADGSVSFSVDLIGTGLGSLDKSEVRVLAGPYASTPNVGTSYDATTGIFTINHKFTQSALINKDYEMGVIVNYGAGDEKTYPMTSSVDIAEEKTVGDYITYIDYSSASEAIHVGAKAAAADVESVDGKDTVINSDGSVTIKATITGTGLNSLDTKNVKIVAGPYASTPNVGVVHNGDTEVNITHTFSQASLVDNNYSMSVIVNYGTADEQTLPLVASVDNSDEKTVGEFTTYIKRTSATTAIEVGATKNAVEVSNLDAKNTKINSDGSVTISADLTGTGVEELSKTNVKVVAGRYASTPNDVSYNGSTNTTTVTHTYSQASLKDIEYDLSLIVNYGTTNEETLPLVSSVDISDELDYDGYTTYIDFTSTTTGLKIGANPISNATIDEASIDGSKSVINADGGVTVVATIEGENLNLIDPSLVKIKAGIYNNTAEVTVNSTNTELTATRVFPVSTLINYDFDISLVLDYGTADENVMPLTASEATQDELELTETTTFINIDDADSTMNIGATINEDEFIDLAVSGQTSIPTYEQGSYVSASDLVADAGLTVVGDGPFVYMGAVKTDNLDINAATITVTELSGDRESLTTVVYYDVVKANVDLVHTNPTSIPVYDKGEAVTPAQLLDDAGISYTGDLPITLTGTVDTTTAGNRYADILFQEKSGDFQAEYVRVYYTVDNGFIDLTVDYDDSYTPTYTVGTEFPASQLAADSHVTYDGDGPIYIGYYFDIPDYNTEGPGSVYVRFLEQSGDKEHFDVMMNYEMVAPDITTEITPGIEIPDYEIGTVVDAEQLFNDTGSVVNGLAPFTYTGTVDTSTVGEHQAEITVTGANGSEATVTLTYNVINAIDNADIISAIGAVGTNGLSGYASVNYAYEGDLTDVRIEAYRDGALELSVDVTEETTNGNVVLDPLTVGVTYEIRLVKGETVLDTEDVTIPVSFDANDFFDVYAIGNDDVHYFNSGNWITLTNSLFGTNQNRGAYSKYKIDTSQPFHFDGKYSMDETFFPAASGIAMMFYQSKDGQRNHTGDTGESLGLYENGSSYVDHGIAVSADMYNTDDSWGNGTHYGEIIDPTRGDSDDPYEITKVLAGRKNRPGFWTREEWKKFEIIWTPYENDAAYSGHLTAKIGDPQGDKDDDGYITVESDITHDLFPQGYYWFKLDATTGGAIVANVNTGITIDGVEAAWVSPTAAEIANNETFVSTYDIVSDEEVEASKADADLSEFTETITKEELEELVASN